MSDEYRFAELTADFDNAMLVTTDIDGNLRARPMRIAEMKEGGDLWFVTDENSAKADELEANAVVCVTMQGGGKYLSLSGTAEMLKDKQRLDELWSEPWKIWFPGGKDDPAIALIRVTPEQGEFWDMSGTNRLRFLYEAGKAWIAGEEIDKDAVESMGGKVDF